MKNLYRVLLIFCLIAASLAAFSSCIGTAKTYTLEYIAGEGGSIIGTSFQVLENGNSGTEVAAKADSGYAFSHWSDGLLEDTRLDKNVLEDKVLIAVFAKTDGMAEVMVSYIAGEGGLIIEGEIHSVLYGESLTVTARAGEGYEFVKWSDDVFSSIRTDDNIRAEFTVVAIFAKVAEPVYIEVAYLAGTGGSIEEGSETHTILYGGSAGAKAVADDGYEFVRWSDGRTDNPRADENITSETTIIAIFKTLTKTFEYIYNKATDNNEIESVTINYNSLDYTTFIIPTKEYFTFDGWYLDSDYKTQVADENGNIKADNKVFESESDNLYAKWTPINEITHKILMIYTTEIKATLYTKEGTRVDVDYKMSNLERQICELITLTVEKTLNDLFDGLVTFQLDNYFTTIPLDESNVSAAALDGKRNYYVEAVGIPEVGPILKNYRNVITTHCFNDYARLLILNTAGAAGMKFAHIALEAAVRRTLGDSLPLETLLDLTYKDWKWISQIYLHELSHTIELDLGLYGFHSAIIENMELNGTQTYETIELYLTNKLELNGAKVGVPYAYWSGDVDVRVNYVAKGPNGEIAGTVNGGGSFVQKVPYGSDMEVTAEPHDGYKFVGWSDGITTATRKDTNITSYLTVKAFFEKTDD